MAIAMTALDSGADTTNQQSYNSNSIAPSANALVLAAVLNSHATAADVVTPTGNGLTWVQVQTQPFHTGGLKRLSLFRAMGAAPSAGAVNFAVAGTTNIGLAYSIAEFTGVDTSGTNGSGAIRNPDKTFDDTGVSSLVINLPAFLTDSLPYGTFGHTGTTQAITPGSGFTQIHDVNHPTPNATLFSEWHATTADTSVDASWTGTPQCAGIALEIVAATAGAQFARPDADISDGGWLDHLGTGNLFARLDEVSPDDADYIEAGASATCEIRLSDVTDPVSSTGHIMRIRCNDSNAQNVEMRLFQGAVQKAGAFVGNATIATYTHTLDASEADSITDYSDLRVKFISHSAAGTTRVYWFEFEVPLATLAGQKKRLYVSRQARHRSSRW